MTFGYALDAGVKFLDLDDARVLCASMQSFHGNLGVHSRMIDI